MSPNCSGHVICTECLNSDEIQETRDFYSDLIYHECLQLTAGDVYREFAECFPHSSALGGLRQLQALTSSSSEQKGAGGEVEKAEQCRVHAGELLRVECVPCKKLVCFRCVSEGGGHCGHSYTRIRGQDGEQAGQEGEQACRIVPSCGAAGAVSSSFITTQLPWSSLQAEEIKLMELTPPHAQS